MAPILLEGSGLAVMATARAAIDKQIAAAMAADVTHGYWRRCLGFADHPPLGFPVSLRQARSGAPKAHEAPGGRAPRGRRRLSAGEYATGLLQDYFLVCFRNISSGGCTGLNQPPLPHDQATTLLRTQIACMTCPRSSARQGRVDDGKICQEFRCDECGWRFAKST